MIKKLPFILFLMFAVGLVAQTTHNLGWANDGSSKNQSITIEQGDIIIWTWGSGTHNLRATSGTESFDSGYLTGAGNTFTYTFNQVGSTDYVCDPHPSNMVGTITVVAEGALSTSEARRLKFEMFPNPGSDKVSIQLPSGAENATVEFYDSLGRLALSKKVTRINNKMDVNALSKGIYILKVFTADQIGSQKFIKN